MPETQMIRPGVGTIGRPVQVTANAYKVKVPNLVIHHYDIHLKPEGGREKKDAKDSLQKDLPPALARKIFQELKKSGAFLDVAAVYDGKRNIYTPKKLDYPQDSKIFNVEIPDDDDDDSSAPLIEGPPPVAEMGGGGGGDRGRGGGRGGRGGDRGGRGFDRGGAPRGRGRGGAAPAPPARAPPAAAAAPAGGNVGDVRPARTQSFSAKIEKVGEADVLALTRFVKKQDAPPADGAVLIAINALNVLCNHDVMMNYVSKKGNKFFPQPRILNEDIIQLSQGLDIWRGYFSSLRMAPGGLILNFDITSQVMIRPGNLVGRLMELLGKQDPQQLINLPSRERLAGERALKALVIAAKVAGDRTIMKKKAQELTALGADALRFKLEDGRSTSVADYFLETHNYRLKYPKLPCVRLSKRALYPLEICHVANGQKYNAKLTPDQLASAIKWLTVRPPDRMRMLESGLRANFFQPNPNKPSTMDAWGLSLEKASPMQLKGRVIDPPKVILKEKRGANFVDSPFVPRDGSWDMRSKSLCKPAQPITAWIAMVCLRPGGRFFAESDLDNSVNGFMEGMRNSGIGINAPMLKLWAGKNKTDMSPPGDLQGYLRTQVRQKNLPKPQLVVCYFDDKNSWQYAEIKKFGDVLTGTATQGLAIQKAKRGNPQYYGNVALKVNVKLGGSNQLINPSELGPAFQKPTMILGADVAHPGPGSTRPSIAGVVASMNKNGTGYVPEFGVQEARAEMIVNLDKMVKSLLLRFKEENKILPENIIFYRDGVSEGQFAIVLSDEIPLLRKACYEVNSQWHPRLTFIICGKRHHYRFGAVNPGDMDKSGNLKPGVVVDTDLVHPYDFDWYCQSHAGLLGTSRSAHYTVLVDDSQYSADVLQKLTYYLCYLYSRATRSVSIVTPAYYAHHICTRVHLWLAADDDDDGSTILTGSSGDKDRQRTLSLEAWSARETRLRKNMTDLNRRFTGEFWM